MEEGAGQVAATDAVEAYNSTESTSEEVLAVGEDVGGSQTDIEDLVRAGVPAEFASDVAALRAAVKADGFEPLSDPLTLFRFLLARASDVEQAAAMYREAVAWRAEYSISRVMEANGHPGHYYKDGRRRGDLTDWSWSRSPNATPEAALIQRHAFFGRLSTPAPDGGPIMIWRIGSADWAGYEREELFDILLPALAAHYEDSLQAARAASLREGRLVQARLVVDAFGVTFAILRCMKFFQLMVDVIGTHYPEMLSSITVVRAPGFVESAWPIFRSVVPPKSREKVAFFGMDFEASLRAHAGGIERAVLPQFLGGEANDEEVCSSLPVPVGAAVQ